MHRCIVCGNSTSWTKVTRPEILYHCFPRNEYLKKKWLKVFGFDQCYDWQRICSNHFLDENYRPGKKKYLLPNTIPQPYDKSCYANGVPSNTITQNNDTETGNYEFLQMEHNLLREENIEIIFINKNEDISYENMPTTTKDFTVGNGIRCSIKNCHNRHSKDLSLFGYPSDLALRKKWIENCGLEVDPIEKIMNSIRVCSAHFENDCFRNSEKKNRLKPKAVPTLFLDVDVIDTRNISSSSSHVNSEYIDANQPSCSSSKYIANVESNQTPLLVYVGSTTHYAKDLEANCSVPGCKTNTDTYKEVEGISLFAPTKHYVNELSSILGLQLTVNSILCERHFRPQDILKSELLVNGFNNKIKSLLPASLPVPINAVQSSSYAMSVTKTFILGTYGRKLKRLKADEADVQLSKKIRNNVPDGTHQNISTSDLKPILSLNVSDFIDNQPMFLKPISTTNTPYSSELPKIETPVIPECISLARNSEVDTSECIIIDDDTEDNGFIFEISKSVVLPTSFWRIEHHSTQNLTRFYQRDMFDLTVKKINFFNSLVPIIQVYGKKYEYNNCIKTKNELENLLDKIDDIEECFGMDGFVHEKCIGYFEYTLEDIEMCSACQGITTNQSLQKINAIIEFKSKTIESIEKKISKRRARVLELKKKIEENRKMCISLRALNHLELQIL